MAEDEMVAWHHRLDGHGFGWTLGVGDGQGGLACCSSWGRKESDMPFHLYPPQSQLAREIRAAPPHLSACSGSEGVFLLK